MAIIYSLPISRVLLDAIIHRIFHGIPKSEGIMANNLLPMSVGMGVLWCGVQAVAVGAEAEAAWKARGIGLTAYTQQQDLRVTDFTVDNPLLYTLLPANAKDVVTIENKINTAGVKLDYQVAPPLNVFVGVEQVSGEAMAKLSALPGLGLADMYFDADGVLYNVGATASAQRGRYVGALTYVHTVSDTQGGIEGGSADTLLPTVGVLTDVGVFNAGLVYQQAQVDYKGTVNLPVFGAVAATVKGETADKLAYHVGYQTALGKDLYLDAKAGFGGQTDARLELNKRF
jgi:hypothetical protein